MIAITAPVLVAILNTCAVPLRRVEILGVPGWCPHHWCYRLDQPFRAHATAECIICKHSMTFPNALLEGNHDGDD